MNSYFSYIDTTLRIIHINKLLINPQDVDPTIDVLRELETSAHAKSEMRRRLLIKQLQENQDLWRVTLHEYHHYWQSLFYPFLYIVHLYEFLTVVAILGGELRRQSAKEFQLKTLGLGPVPKFNLEYLTLKFLFSWKDNELTLVEDTSVSENLSEVFSMNDLIEDATTIFEFKANNPGAGFEDFSKWIRNPKNKCYKRLYKFIAKIIGDQNSFNLLPLLIQLSFYTTEPLSAFCSLFNYLIKFELIDRKEFKGDELDFSLLKTVLQTNFPKAEIDFSNISIQELPVTYLDDQIIDSLSTLEIKNGSTNWLFPLSVHFKKFVHLRGTPEFEFSLIDKIDFKMLMKNFQPYCVHYNFIDLTSRNSFMWISEEFEKIKVSEHLFFREYLMELYKCKEATLSIFTSYQHETPHYCHHASCDYYATQLCQKWTHIPTFSIDCGFPYWFGFSFSYKINSEKKTLEKLTAEEQKLYAEKYFKQSYKGGDFDYYKMDDGNFVLTINKETVLSDKHFEHIQKFIQFLSLTFKKSYNDLLECLVLDFYGYDNDDREIFEIPEIKEWLVRSKQRFPEMLMFLNFKKDNFKYKAVILPNYFNYKKLSKGSNFGVRFDEKEFSIFMAQEIKIITDYSRRNNIPVGRVNQILNNIFYGSGS